MKSIAITIILVLSASMACAQCEDCFLGAWNWESTTLGDGTVITPGDSGIYIQLQFLADNTFIRFENMEIVQQGQWFLSSFWVENVCVTSLSTTVGDYWYEANGQPFSNLHLPSGLWWESPDIAHFTFIAPTPTTSNSLDSIKSLYR